MMRIFHVVTLDWGDEVLGVDALKATEPLDAALRMLNNHGKNATKCVVSWVPGSATDEEDVVAVGYDYKVFERQQPERDRWPVSEVDQ